MKTTSAVLAFVVLFGTVGQTEARVRSTSVDLEFAPTPEPISGLESLKVCLLPVLNSSDSAPHMHDAEKALKGLEPDERSQVIGLRYNTHDKPTVRFLASRPVSGIIEESLLAEFEALGATVIPSPLDRSTATVSNSMVLGMFKDLPRESVPDIVVHAIVKDFYFHLRRELVSRVGTGVGSSTRYDVRTRMGISCVLYTAVFDTTTGQALWTGMMKTGDAEEKGLIKSNAGATTRINLALHNLIEEVLRNNSDLQERLKAVEFTAISR